jgi:hypothetical protein
MNARTQTLSIVSEINTTYNRPATLDDVQSRARVTRAQAVAELESLLLWGRIETDDKGVWLTEAGAEELRRDRPTPLPDDARVIASEVEDT